MVTRRGTPAQRAHTRGTRARPPAGRRRARTSRRTPFVIPIAITAIATLAAGLWFTRSLIVGDPPPTALRADRTTTTSAVLHWNKSGNAERYVVHIASDRAFTQDVRTVEANTNTVTVSKLAASTPGHERFFRVDAVRGKTSTPSRTGRFHLAPGPMSPVKVSQRSATGVRLQWKAVANANQYDVQIALNKSFTGETSTVRTLGSDATFVQTGLRPTTRYWFRVRPVSGDITNDFGTAVAAKTLPREVSFNVATWNVCSERCRGYASRARVMAEVLNNNAVDLFVLQEAGGKRVGPTTNAIFSGGSRGFVRATGGAKARYVFYRPALFDQHGGGHFSVGKGRYATWAELSVKATGRKFIIVDVHLDNPKKADGRRRAQTQTMISRMRSINTANLPMIYAGDFNSGPHRPSDSPGALMRSIGMSNTVDLAENPINRDINTGHTFATTVPRSGAHVDHIFVSPEFSVLGWRQIVRIANGRYVRPVVSDHNPLQAIVSLDGQREDLGPATPTDLIPGLTGGNL